MKTIAENCRPPIGVLTRNRHTTLDVTLRSLSATDLSKKQQLAVFDDGSTDRTTLAYLYSNETVRLFRKWNFGPQQAAVGLSDIASRKRGKGLRGTILVRSLGNARQGVVVATCSMIRQMESLWPSVKETGLILLQDDVVFLKDWLQRLLYAAKTPKRNKPASLVCGVWLNYTVKNPRNPLLISARGVTAQCYYVTPLGLQTARSFINRAHVKREGFDNGFCSTIRKNGGHVYLANPPVCQHIGLESAIRPRMRWHWASRKGRVGYDGIGPYLLAKTPRIFCS